MRWEDERYVRLYTRDTTDWLALSFDAQSLLCMLLRKVDRAGLLPLGRHGKRGVAIAIGHPREWERLGPALDELLADGCVRLTDDGGTLIIPNFLEAQTARPSSPFARWRGERHPPTGEGATPEPVLIPSVRIRLKTPEERAAAEAEHARIMELNRLRAQKEQTYREEMKAAKRAAARVYFIQQDGSEGLVKIGTTTRDVAVRLKELQAGHSCPLVVRASAPGGRTQESDLHWRFAPLRVSGEWFRPGDDLLAYVALVADRGTL